MAQVQARKGKQKPAKKVIWEFPLTKKNWMIIGAGGAAILIGFLMMATAITDDPVKHQEVWNNVWAISIAPIVLVLGFIVLIPYGIFWRDKSNDTTDSMPS